MPRPAMVFFLAILFSPFSISFAWGQERPRNPQEKTNDLALWRLLQESDWVAVGSANPTRVVYTFTDPKCPYCHFLYRASLPYTKAGLQVRHIIVGVLGPKSVLQAAAILEAKDPQKALVTHEENFSSGGIPPVNSPRPETIKKLGSHQVLMTTLGIQGTPATFSLENGKLQGAFGMPHLSDLPKLFGLPEQKQDDPALLRFR